ncbi:hypothetical protein BH09PSE5_BH09PSE5_13810 [soil metagenome]
MTVRRSSSGHLPRGVNLRAALRAVAALVFALASVPVFAIQVCEIDGRSVNPNNGSTTANKTGLMRCRDSDSGVIVREQELQNGKFMGVVRYFKAGLLEREHSVNERGNQDGVSREWEVTEATRARVLVRESTYSNGDSTGVSRNWYSTGEKRRLTYYGADHREQASVEFTREGKLSALRCAATPVFTQDFDDGAACGHAGRPSVVEFYGSKSQPVSRVTFERGERRKVENLWDNGAVRSVRETLPTGGYERLFAQDGTLRHVLEWTTFSLPAADGAAPRPRSVNTLEQDFHESGKMILERRWTPTERTADLLYEATWYLNGQPKTRSDYSVADSTRVRLEKSYYDNGKPASEGSWRIGSATSRIDRSERPIGTHASFDQQGRKRVERVFDELGKVTREREYDESGAVTSDDEVFEDGSRKSVGR